jgi:hypothetical protein
MHTKYQARRISKARSEALRKQGRLGGAILLDLLNGFLVVEPVWAHLGDGEVLTPQEADYELQAAWHLGPAAQLTEARRRLGLDTPRAAHAGR